MERFYSEAEFELVQEERDAAIARAERAEAELAENEGVIKVWRRREAEAHAHAEALRGALESLKDPRQWKRGGAGGQDKYAGLPPAMRVIDEALALTPPTALAQQRERMERLEAVAEALPDLLKAYKIEHESLRQSRSKLSNARAFLWTRLKHRLAALDAKGGA